MADRLEHNVLPTAPAAVQDGLVHVQRTYKRVRWLLQLHTRAAEKGPDQ